MSSLGTNYVTTALQLLSGILLDFSSYVTVEVYKHNTPEAQSGPHCEIKPFFIKALKIVSTLLHEFRKSDKIFTKIARLQLLPISKHTLVCF